MPAATPSLKQSSVPAADCSQDRRLAWHHAALVVTRHLTVGSPAANQKLKALLNAHGSMEAIYDHHLGHPAHDPASAAQLSKLDQAHAGVRFPFRSITIHDRAYPDQLRQVQGAPPVLYCRGDVGLLKQANTIAFVGTRELHKPAHLQHGEQVIRQLIALGRSTIVSGLATGSDTLGHEAAIAHGGRTIAVLGTPLNIYYPSANRRLQDQIGDHHLLVSEYPIGLRPAGYYFAHRNLTTVALARQGIVVARAGDRSGTRYAIRHCLRQGKPLYVLENNLNEPPLEERSAVREAAISEAAISEAQGGLFAVQDADQPCCAWIKDHKHRLTVLRRKQPIAELLDRAGNF